MHNVFIPKYILLWFLYMYSYILWYTYIHIYPICIHKYIYEWYIYICIYIFIYINAYICKCVYDKCGYFRTVGCVWGLVRMYSLNFWIDLIMCAVICVTRFCYMCVGHIADLDNRLQRTFLYCAWHASHIRGTTTCIYMNIWIYTYTQIWLHQWKYFYRAYRNERPGFKVCCI